MPEQEHGGRNSQEMAGAPAQDTKQEQKAASPSAALDRLAEEAATAPARPQRQRPQRTQQPRRRSPYRNGALLVLGLILCAVLISGATLIWSWVVFSQQLDVAESTAAPLLIFLAALFLSSAVITLFSRGGTLYPVLALCLIACLVSFFLAGLDNIRIGGVLLKLLLALLDCTAAFTLVKLYFTQKDRRYRAKDRAA